MVKKEFTKKVVLNKVFGPKVPKNGPQRARNRQTWATNGTKNTFCEQKTHFFVKRRRRKGNRLYLTGSLMLLK